jgi:hypothetical protein
MRVPASYLPEELRNRNAKKYTLVAEFDVDDEKPPLVVESNVGASVPLHCLLAMLMLLSLVGLVISMLLGIDIYSSSIGYLDAVQVQPVVLCQDYPIGSISLHAFPETDWLQLNGQTLQQSDYPEFYAMYCALDASECTETTILLPNLTNTAIVPYGTLRSDSLLLPDAPQHKHDYTVEFVESTPTCEHEHSIESSSIQSAAWVHTHDVSATVRTGESGGHRHGFITEEGRDYKNICEESTTDPFSCRSKRHTTWEGGHQHQHFKYDTTPVVKSSPFVFKNAESCSADADATSMMQGLWAILDFAISNFASPKYADMYGNAMDNLDLLLLATGSCEDCGLAKASGVCDRGEVTAHNGGYIATDDVDTANCYPTPDVVNQPEGFSNVASARTWLRGHAMRHDARLKKLNDTHANSTFIHNMEAVATLMGAHSDSLRTIVSALNHSTPSTTIPRAVLNAARFDTVLETSVHRAVTTAIPRRRLLDDRGEGDNSLDYTCDNQYPTERNCAVLDNWGGRFVESCKIFEQGSRDRIWTDDWAEGCLEFDGYERDCFASARGTVAMDSKPTKSLTGVDLLTGCDSNDECCAEFDNRPCIAGGAPTDAWGTPTLNPLESSDAPNPGCTSDMCCKRWGEEKTCNEAFNHACCELDAPNPNCGGFSGNDCCLEYNYKDGIECLEFNYKTGFNCNEAVNPSECAPCTHNAIALSAGITGTDCCEEYDYKDGDQCQEWNTVTFNCEGTTDCSTEEGCAEWNYVDTTCATFNTKEVTCEGRTDCGSWTESSACLEWNWGRDFWNTCEEWNYERECVRWGCYAPTWDELCPSKCEDYDNVRKGCKRYKQVKQSCKRFNTKEVTCEGRTDCSPGCKTWNKARSTCKRFNSKTISCQGSTRCPLPREGGCKRWNQVKDKCARWKQVSVSCEGRLDCGDWGCKRWNQVKDTCAIWATCEAIELCAELDTCIFDGCKRADKCFVRTGCKQWSKMRRRAMACGCEECWPYEGNEWRYAADAVGQVYGYGFDAAITSIDAFGTAYAECVNEAQNAYQGAGKIFTCVEDGIDATSMEAAGYGCRAGSGVISDMHVEDSNLGSIMQNHDLLTYLDEWMFAPHYGFDDSEEPRAWPKGSDPLEKDGTEYYASTRDGNTGCPLNRCVWEIDKDDNADEYSCRIITQDPVSSEEVTLCHDENDNRIHYRVGDSHNFECLAPNQPQSEDVGSGDPVKIVVEHPKHDTLYPFCRSYGAPSAWDDIRMTHDEKMEAFNTNFGLGLKNEDFKTRHTHPCEGEIQTHPWYHKHDVTGSCEPMQPSGAHTHTAGGKTDSWTAQQDCLHKHSGEVRVLPAEEQQLPLDTTPPYVQHPHYIRVKGCPTY